MPKPDKVKLNIKERVEDTVCDLSLSELSEVPVRELASYKRVVHLDLSSNRLLTLGKNFTTLTRLTKLDLSKNQIRFLPEDFGQLENLRHLDLYNNRLEHIPLSFRKLARLRYLDLKGNPLTPAWEKIVGLCLTTKDCQFAARNVVYTCGELQLLADKELQAVAAMPQHLETSAAGEANNQPSSSISLGTATSATCSNSKKSKKNKKKQKQLQQQQQNQRTRVNENAHTIREVNLMQQQQQLPNNDAVGAPTGLAVATAPLPNNRNNARRKINNNANQGRRIALKTIVTFLILLAINFVIVYVVTFKNPEIADAIVEYIPQQYRNWILTKSEFFRLRISDWVAEFQTPPEEH